MNKLQTTIKLTQLLYNSSCTYDEVDEFLFDMLQHYKELREQKEYDTASDYINGYRSRDVGNKTVDPLPDIITIITI